MAQLQDMTLTYASDVLEAARQQVLDRVDTAIPHADKLVSDARQSLHQRLTKLSARVLMLELQAASISGALTGNDPGARYQSFLQRLASPQGRHEIRATYPELHAATQLMADMWADATSEFMTRLGADLAVLHATFGSDTPEGIVASGSDAHGQGRQVWFVRFEHGPELVYKPRSLAIDVRLDAVVRRLGLDLELPDTMDRGAYGWARRILPAACVDDAAAGRFHQRLGSWIALFWLLGGTDMHFENIIAAGDQPVPVDVEMLMNPWLVPAEHATADDRAVKLLGDSIRSVGMLPEPRMLQDGVLSDFSGIGAGVGRRRGLVPVDIGTDRARIDEGHIPEFRADNLARIGDRPVDPFDYVDEFEQGFRSVVELVRTTSARVLVDAFRDCSVRFVTRPTSWYTDVLKNLAHPHMLVSPTSRGQLLDDYLAPQADESWRTPFLESERRQLEAWDVPRFDVELASGNLTGGDGRFVCTMPDWASGSARAKARIASINRPDGLRQQLWVLRASLARRRQRGYVDADTVRGDSMMSIARAAGDLLAQRAVEHREEATWLTMTSIQLATSDEDRWTTGLVENDLYDGLSGIVLFLASLGHATGDQDYEQLARHALACLDRRSHVATDPGAFAGEAGQLYLRCHLARMWGVDTFTSDIERRIQTLAELRSANDELDLTAGAAGTICCLLHAHRQQPSSQALDVAIDYAERLGSVVKDTSKLRFRRGFAHGASGMAFALGRLGAESGEGRYVDGALRMLLDEAELIGTDGWCDRASTQCAWCHGASGIAIARAYVARLTDDATLTRLAREAASHLVAATWPRGDALCHGSVGNLLALQRVARAFPDDFTHELASRRDALITLAAGRGLVASTPRGLFSPGLMTGVAGIGLGALSLAQPDAMPCVLTLE